MSDSLLRVVPRDSDGSTAPGLEVSNLSAGYHGLPVVFGVDLIAYQGQVTALFGHNGAGKTSLLRASVGLVERLGGTVSIQGSDMSTRSTRDLFRAGVVYLPQDHATFPALSVAENLEVGAMGCSKREKRERLRHVHQVFPLLEERRRSKAQTLSGGQQRMLSIGAALMADAQVLLLDEPSLGLAPALTQSLLGEVQKLAHAEGRTVVLVEQAIGQALPVVDRVYVMRSGKVVGCMGREEALAREDWTDVY